MYLAYASGGNFGLIVLKTTVVLGAFAALLMALKPAMLEAPIHDLFIFLSFAGMFGRTHVLRPQIFSVTLFSLLLVVLSRVEKSGARTLLLGVPFIFLFWVNLHGGWIVGAGVLAAWTVVSLLSPNHTRRDRVWLCTIALLSVAATLVNPYGWRMWSFLAETVRFQRSDIAEWAPLWKLPLFAITPWCVAAALVVFALFKGLHSKPAAALITILCGAASLRVSRLDVFFTLSAVMFCAPAFANPRHRGAVHTAIGKSGAAALLGVAMLALAIVGARARWRCVFIDDRWPPEPEVVSFVHQNHLRGRMLTFFDWGEYAIWHLAPDIQISFDGRRETVYSQRVIDDHSRIYQNLPDAQKVMAELGAEYAWLPSNLAAVQALKTAGWTPLFAGPMSILLKSPTTSTETQVGSPLVLHDPPASAWGTRCFPGP